MLPKGKRLPLFLTLICVYWFSFCISNPVLTEYTRAHSSSRMAGVIIASYSLVQTLVRIPLGILSDARKTRKYFIALGLVLNALGLAALLLPPTPALMLLARVLMGAGVSTWAPFSILYTSYLGPRQAASAIGITNACNYIGQMLGTLVGGYVVTLTGNVRAPFLIGGVTALVGAAMACMIIDQDKAQFPQTRAPIKAYLAIGKSRSVFVASLLAILIQLCSQATLYGFTPTFAAQRAHANAAQMGMLFTVALFPGIFSAPLAGWFSRICRGAPRVLAGCFLVSAAYCVAVPHITHIYLLFALQVVFGFARGLCVSLLMSQCIADVTPAQRGTAMGFFQAIYGVGMTLGPLIVGAFAGNDHAGVNLAGLANGFYAVALLQLAGTLLSLVLYRKRAAYSKAA
nr:MFS transporter [Maliibacterium massiliense]